jgi:hypothetical protein
VPPVVAIAVVAVTRPVCAISQRVERWRPRRLTVSALGVRRGGCVQRVWSQLARMSASADIP